MDTKLKSNKHNKVIGVLLGLFLITILAVVMVELYTPIYKNTLLIKEQNATKQLTYEKENKEYYKEEFMKTLYRSNLALYLKVLQRDSIKEQLPSDILLAESMKVTRDEDINYEKEMYLENFNNIVNAWYENFFSITVEEYPSFYYYVIDNKTNNESTNSIDSLATLADSSLQAKELKEAYPFYIVFQSGEDGSLSIIDQKGLEVKQIDAFLSMQLNNDIIKDETYLPDWQQYNDQIITPANITIIYASKDKEFYNNHQYYYRYSQDYAELFVRAGFGFACIGTIIIIILMALLLPFKKSWGIGKGFASRIPLEIIVVSIFYVLYSYISLAAMASESITAGFIFDKDNPVLSILAQKVIMYGFNILVWMVVFLIWYVGILSLRQVFTLGLKRFIKEKTLTGSFLCWFLKKMKRVITLLEEIDLSAKSNKTMIKILVINFIILALICCVWVLGILLLIPYSMIAFFILRKYLDDTKKKYAILLEATSKIADGKLEVTIDENLGIFEPLKEELTKVQQGFLKAVREETKSERMKTELITNVSHDLKTPLTAIITYVDLLKDANVSEEDRLSYINTLDMKSQRLKRLIEDLFEVSKASSNNLTLNIIAVDLVNLIKQVLIELDDKIKLLDIEFRLNLPEQKVFLNLDSEKTYRIFENLIINITKYAMPHTRAYIDLLVKEDKVIVMVKNMSASELNFNTEEISERFVRGDLSRNTEGSGLGLAISKSFVELQGGKFEIIADGDLFKVVIEWKYDFS